MAYSLSTKGLVNLPPVARRLLLVAIDALLLPQDRAVYWFRPRSEQREIQILAVFFGGQNHQRRMLVRLLQKSSDS